MKKNLKKIVVGADGVQPLEMIDTLGEEIWIDTNKYKLKMLSKNNRNWKQRK